MKNPFDELNSVIKSMSTICDMHHHAMQTVALKVNTKKEAACFIIYLSLQEIYNNNRTKSENTMILLVQ